MDDTTKHKLSPSLKRKASLRLEVSDHLKSGPASTVAMMQMQTPSPQVAVLVTEPGKHWQCAKATLLPTIFEEKVWPNDPPMSFPVTKRRKHWRSAQKTPLSTIFEEKEWSCDRSVEACKEVKPETGSVPSSTGISLPPPDEGVDFGTGAVDFESIGTGPVHGRKRLCNLFRTYHAVSHTFAETLVDTTCGGFHMTCIFTTIPVYKLGQMKNHFSALDYEASRCLRRWVPDEVMQRWDEERDQKERLARAKSRHDAADSEGVSADSADKSGDSEVWDLEMAPEKLATLIEAFTETTKVLSITIDFMRLCNSKSRAHAITKGRMQLDPAVDPTDPRHLVALAAPITCGRDIGDDIKKHVDMVKTIFLQQAVAMASALDSASPAISAAISAAIPAIMSGGTGDGSKKSGPHCEEAYEEPSVFALESPEWTPFSLHGRHTIKRALVLPLRRIPKLRGLVTRLLEGTMRRLESETDPDVVALRQRVRTDILEVQESRR